MAAEGVGACKCSPRRPFLSPQPSSQAQAQAARAAARALQLLSYQERVHILEAMADALEEHVHEIVSANQARAVDCH
jgi:gamma-glutamyl phosphate reductase